MRQIHRVSLSGCIDWNLDHTCQYERGSPKVDSLVIAELSVCHVTMVANDLSHMFRWHVFLLCLHKPKLALLTVAFRL